MSTKQPDITAAAWANVSTRAKLGSDDENITFWVVGDSVILCVQFDATTAWGPNQYKIQWRASGGSYADLGAGTAIAYETDSDLTNGGAVTSGEAKCSNVPSGSTWEDGEEAEGTGTWDTYTHTDEYYTEFQVALNTDNAAAETTYEFQIYDITDGSALGTIPVTLTTGVAESAQGVVFSDDFEDGTTNAWTSTPGSPAVTASGLASTSYKLECTVTQQPNQEYASKTLATEITTGVLRVRHYFDPNAQTSIDNQVYMFRFFNGATVVGVIEIEYAASSFQTRAGMVDDAAADNESSYYTHTDDEHYVEVLYKRATTQWAADGSLQIWIGGVSKETVSNIDNWDRWGAEITTVEFGVCYYNGTSTGGEMYFDEIVIRDDDTEIGEVANDQTVILDVLTLASAPIDLTVVSTVSVPLDVLTLASAPIDLTVSAPPPAQTVPLDVLTLASAPIDLTVVPGATSVNLDVLTLVSTPIDLTVVSTVSVALDVLTLASAPIDLAVVSTVSVLLDVLTLASTAIDLTVIPGAVTVSLDTLTLASAPIDLSVDTSTTVLLDVLTLASAAIDLTVVPGAVTIPLDVLTLASAPIDLTVDSSTNVLLDVLTLASAAIDLSVVPGAITVSLDVLTLASAPIDLTVDIGGASVSLDVLTLSSSAIDLTPVGGAVSVSLDVLTLASAPIDLSVVGGPVSVALDVLALASAPIDLSVIPGAVTVPLDVLSLASGAIDLSVSVPSAQTIPLDVLLLSLGAQDLSVNVPSPPAPTQPSGGGAPKRRVDPRVQNMVLRNLFRDRREDEEEELLEIIELLDLIDE